MPERIPDLLQFILTGFNIEIKSGVARNLRMPVHAVPFQGNIVGPDVPFLKNAYLYAATIRDLMRLFMNVTAIPEQEYDVNAQLGQQPLKKFRPVLNPAPVVYGL